VKSQKIDFLIQDGRMFDVIGLEGRRIDVGCLESREEAEEQLAGENLDSTVT